MQASSGNIPLNRYERNGAEGVVQAKIDISYEKLSKRFKKSLTNKSLRVKIRIEMLFYIRKICGNFCRNRRNLLWVYSAVSATKSSVAGRARMTVSPRSRKV